MYQTLWQLRFWVQAQAGNGAGKTGRYLQWWDTRPECNAVTSTECKVHNSTFFSAHSRQALAQTWQDNGSKENGGKT